MLDYPHFLLSCYNQRTPDYIFPKYKLVQPCRFSVKRPNALLPNFHWEQYVPWNLPLGEKPNTFSVQNKIYLWSTIPSGDIHVQFFCQWFLLVILTGVHPSKPKMHNFDYAVNGTSVHKSIISLLQWVKSESYICQQHINRLGFFNTAFMFLQQHRFRVHPPL